MASLPLATTPPTGFLLRQVSLAAVNAPALLLALWQLACASGLFPPQVLVPPSGVAKALIDMAASGELQRHVGDSLYRLLVGFAIGASAGMAFGAALALSRLIEAALSPLFHTSAWVVLVAAELLAADSGIGQMMEMGRQLFQIDVVLAGVVVSGLIGFLLDRGARWVESRASRWRTA